VADLASGRGDVAEFIYRKSGMMRDRVNLKDVDMQEAIAQFDKGVLDTAKDAFSKIGMWLMQRADFAVAAPGWLAMYRKATEESKEDAQAVAIADEFIAKTQGAARPIDLSPIQLSATGRLFTVFYSAASALGTYRVNRVNRVWHERGKGALPVLLNTFLAPMAINALIAWAFTGADDDDPDKPAKRAIAELIKDPFSGLFAIQDVADAVDGLLSGRRQGEVFDTGVFDAVNDAFTDVADATQAALHGNPAGVTYHTIDLFGTLYHMPVVDIYDRLQRQTENALGIELLPNIKEMSKDTPKRKRR
jgi:hypothetical protein